jgi:hypothetical protein
MRQTWQPPITRVFANVPKNQEKDLSKRANRGAASHLTLGGRNRRPFSVWESLLHSSVRINLLDTSKSMKVSEIKILTNYYQLI